MWRLKIFVWAQWKVVVSFFILSKGNLFTYSSSYGSTQLDSELLQRQTFATSHQPTFTTTHHPTGEQMVQAVTIYSHSLNSLTACYLSMVSLSLLGVFDSNQHSTASSNTTESSVMNFLSAIESRGLQAGPAGSTLLPPFRSPSWQTGKYVLGLCFKGTTEVFAATPSLLPVILNEGNWWDHIIMFFFIKMK